MSRRLLIRRICSSVAVIAFVTAVLGVSASGSLAQWRILKTFPEQVRSVYFLDQQGAPNVGFVGLVDGEIWRTSDNGVSWNKTTTPLPSLLGIPVSSFCFKDQNVGWVGVSANSSYNGVWMTNDGGQTWVRLNSISGNVVSVAFNTTSQLLFAISWTGQAKYSADAGVTWTPFAQQNQNGMWFSGAKGVISNLRATSFLYTADGGANWATCTPTLPTECWAPWAFPGSSVFVAVSEKTRDVLVSSNGGQSWNIRSTFPTSQTPRGCIMGGGGDLYVQTMQGFFVSHDTGATWFSICGPVNDLDTRFYAKGPEIFSGELGRNLWYEPNASANSALQLGFASDSYKATASRCSAQDSTLVFSVASSCGVTLNSIQLISGGPQFQITPGTLPRVITGNGDSLHVHYTPSGARRDSGVVRVRFSISGLTIDTLIPLYGTPLTGATLVAVNPAVYMTLPTTCTERDTMVAIHNIGCDSVYVTAVTLDDPSRVTLDPITLPRGLAQNSSLDVHLLAGSRLSGSFSTTLRVHLRSSTRDFDTTVALWLNVLQSVKPSVANLALAVPTRCVAIDTVLKLNNPNCDSITVLSLKVADTNVFKIDDLSLPFALRANSSIDLPLHVQAAGKGSHSAAVTMTYLDADGYRHDTTAFLVFDVENAVPVRAGFSTTRLDVGAANAPCSSLASQLTIWNTECGLAKIVGVKWSVPDSEFIVSTPTLPITLASGDSTSLNFTFAPKQIGIRTVQLIVTLEVDGMRRDTVLTITGSGQSEFDAHVVRRHVSFDSLRMCETATRQAQIVNTSCDNLVVTKADLGVSGYSVVSPSLPITLRPADTVTFMLRLNPQHSGSAHDSLLVWMHEASDPTEHLRAVDLSGYVLPKQLSASLSTTSLSFTDLEPCTTADSSFTITNKSYCDDLIVDAISVSGDADISIDPSIVLPATLPSSGSLQIPFRIKSVSDTLRTAQIHIVGSWLDTIITIVTQSSSNGRHMSVIAGETNLVTRPCVPTSIERAVVNDGCEPLILDSIYLSGVAGQTQLTTNIDGALPVLLQPGQQFNFTLHFDPDCEGDGTASLHIISEQARFASEIPLTGAVSGSVPLLRVGLESRSATGVRAKAGESVAIDVTALDNVGDSVSPSTLACKLHFNPNLLVFQSLNAAAGWTVVSTSGAETGELTLALSHDAASILNGSPIVEAIFGARVSDSTEDDITISDLRLNGDDPTFERCRLSSLASSSPVHFTFADTCGTVLMRDAVTRTPMLQIVSVSPNPVGRLADGYIDVALSSAVAQPATISLLSDRGVTLRSVLVDLPRGTFSVRLPVATLPTGADMLVVSTDLVRLSRKIVIEH